MGEAFLTVLTLSVSGSLITLLLFLLKPLLKKRTSKTWQYYIYIIVILRLLLPFTPEHSLIGMMAHQVDAHVAAAPAEAELDGMESAAEATSPGEFPDAQVEIEGAVAGDWDYGRASATTKPGLLSLACGIWLAGALLLFLRKLLSYHCFVRSAKAGCSELRSEQAGTVYREVCEDLQIRRSPALQVNPALKAPTLLGVLRPVIALPDDGLDSAQMRHVLYHELTHYKRMDIVYKWLVQAALCLHWFNPLVHQVSWEVNRLCELACDEAVIRRLDKPEKLAYGDMLLDSIKPGPAPPSRTVVSITLCEDIKLIEERLSAIMSYKKKSTASICISAVLAATIFVGATFTGAYAAGSDTAPATQEQPTPSPAISTPNTQASADTPQPPSSITAPVSSPSGNRGEITKSVSGDNVQQIQIYAELCTLVMEKSPTDNFEVVFSYPSVAQTNYSNHFELSVAKQGSNTVEISTNYENQRWDTSFEQIDGMDGARYANEAILTVRVPQKQYEEVRVSLMSTGNSVKLAGVDTSSLSIQNGTGSINISLDRAFDSLSIDNRVGNVTLQLPELGRNLDISNRVGHFVLALPSDPADVNLSVYDLSGDGYDVVSYLPDSWSLVRGANSDSYVRGAGQNSVNVGLTQTSGLEIMIGGVSNMEP